MISSPPDTRNWTDPFIICLILFIVQHWENMKKFGKKKWKKDFMIRIWNRIIKTWKKRENVQFYQGEAISHFPRTDSKMSMLKVLKKSTTMPCICQEVKNSFSKQLNYEVCIEIFHFWHWAASDILTPWHQKLNWSFYHLPHTIYSPALREFEKVWQEKMKDRFHDQDLK